MNYFDASNFSNYIASTQRASPAIENTAMALGVGNSSDSPGRFLWESSKMKRSCSDYILAFTSAAVIIATMIVNRSHYEDNDRIRGR